LGDCSGQMVLGREERFAELRSLEEGLTTLSELFLDLIFPEGPSFTAKGQTSVADSPKSRKELS